jgi:glyoxylase-like metal-dependent hydrolase (beta-lactamase superfamily II)
MSRIEWEFWTSEDSLAQLPEMLAAPARAVLPRLAAADIVDVTDGEAELVDGVRLMPAPGHTPGHSVLAVASGGDSLTFLADAVLDELQLSNPQWVSAVDISTEDTVRTRHRLLDQAVADGSVVMAYHMASVGHVERTTGAYGLTPD